MRVSWKWCVLLICAAATAPGCGERVAVNQPEEEAAASAEPSPEEPAESAPSEAPAVTPEPNLDTIVQPELLAPADDFATSTDALGSSTEPVAEEPAETDVEPKAVTEPNPPAPPEESGAFRPPALIGPSDDAAAPPGSFAPPSNDGAAAPPGSFAPPSDNAAAPSGSFAPPSIKPGDTPASPPAIEAGGAFAPLPPADNTPTQPPLTDGLAPPALKPPTDFGPGAAGSDLLNPGAIQPPTPAPTTPEPSTTEPPKPLVEPNATPTPGVIDDAKEPGDDFSPRAGSPPELAAPLEPADPAPLPPSDSPVGEVRGWSDQSGAYKIEAAFVEQDGDAVRLKQPDGGKLRIAYNQLSTRDQGFVDARANDSATATPRIWTDASGSYQMNASYVSLSQGVLRLQNADGKRFTIDVDSLSDRDQGFVEGLRE